MYDFEKAALKHAWNGGLIRARDGGGSYTTSSHYTPIDVLRRVYMAWQGEDELIRSEYITEVLVLPHLAKLAAGAAGFGMFGLRSAWLDRVGALLDDTDFFGQLEADDFAAAAERGQRMDMED